MVSLFQIIQGEFTHKTPKIAYIENFSVCSENILTARKNLVISRNKPELLKFFIEKYIFYKICTLTIFAKLTFQTRLLLC